MEHYRKTVHSTYDTKNTGQGIYGQEDILLRVQATLQMKLSHNISETKI